MQIQKNISLRPYNTFGIDAHATFFSTFSSVNELHELTTGATSGNSLNSSLNNLLILGGGSNILLTGDFNGLVLKNEIEGIEIVREDEEHVYLKAGAGVNWHHFVLHCINNNLGGVENLSLIPGNVGASPMQNIGAYGVEIKDVFYELNAFHLREKKLHRFSLDECEFGYRESVFKKRYKRDFVILDVTFKLDKSPVFKISYGAIGDELQRMGISELSLETISQAIINIRTSKLPDPKEIGNAGSFFKNPSIPNHQYEILKKEFPAIVGYNNPDGSIKLAAGWLIEQCGWKGYRHGDAGVHAKQALVLVNYNAATGKEIYDLSGEVIESVTSKFNVTLEREVNIIGSS